MKKICFLYAILFSIMLFSQTRIPNDVLKPYIHFLQNNKFHTAKDYFLERFKKYDIVVFSERHHADFSQYQLIVDFLKDKNFKGNVYKETGSSNNNKRINQFLLNPNFTETEKHKELLSIYKDLTSYPIWEYYNYYYLLNEIYEINRTREIEDKILFFPLDVEFNWSDFTCPQQYELFDKYLNDSTVNRNEIMGSNFVKFYESSKRKNPNKTKALVIENTYHGYIRLPKYLPNPTQPIGETAGSYIYKTYPKTTTNIYINYLKTANGFKDLANNGIFDASFDYTNMDNIGFDLKNTPFGKSKFDLYNFGGTDYEEVEYQYIFDGMIFYKPLSKINLVYGIPDICSKEFEDDFYKRVALTENISIEEAKKQNAEFYKSLDKIQEKKLDDKVLENIKQQIDKWFIYKK